VPHLTGWKIAGHIPATIFDMIAISKVTNEKQKAADINASGLLAGKLLG
jgi:hypothetical protein